MSPAPPVSTSILLAISGCHPTQWIADARRPEIARTEHTSTEARGHPRLQESRLRLASSPLPRSPHHLPSLAQIRSHHIGS